MDRASKRLFISFWILVISILIARALSGCYTDKKAQKQLDKALIKKPVLVAKIARDAFPCVTIKSDTTINYLDTTFMVDCPPSASEYFTITDTLRRTDTIRYAKVVRVPVTLPIQYRTITKTIEDSAKIKIITALRDTEKSRADNYEAKYNKAKKWIWYLSIPWLLVGIFLAIRTYIRYVGNKLPFK